MSAQPEPPGPAQEADATPDSASPASTPAAKGPKELRMRLYGTENGSLPMLTQFRSPRTIEDPVSLAVIRSYYLIMKAR
jgi:hypothetical protein